MRRTTSCVALLGALVMAPGALSAQDLFVRDMPGKSDALRACPSSRLPHGVYNYDLAQIRILIPGQSSLERDLEDPNTYRIRPEASVYIEVEDPQRPGYGYGVSIHADSDGPGIETWPYGPNETPQDPDREPEPLDRIDWAFDVVDALLTEEANA